MIRKETGYAAHRDDILLAGKTRDSRVEGNERRDTSGKENRVVFGVLRQIKAWTNQFFLSVWLRNVKGIRWKWFMLLKKMQQYWMSILKNKKIFMGNYYICKIFAMILIVLIVF